MPVIESIIPAASGLTGVLLGAWLIGRQERRRYRLDFVERRVRDFYSPMLGLRREIEVRSEMRKFIQDTASTAWAKLS